jgi:acyl-CoA reductase-like NAD-dependent aldehyde dehydrogenase
VNTLIEVRSPIHGEILKTYRKPAEDEISATMKHAREAFSQWSRIPIRERIRCVHSLRNLIVRRMDDIAGHISEATGKTRTEAVLTELIPTLEIMKYYEKKSVSILRPERRKTTWSFPHSSSYVEYHPLGVVLVLAPWNFPFQLSVVPLISAVIAGNAVILKPSELTLTVGELIEGLCLEAGFPPHVVKTVCGDKETGERLVQTCPDLIFLTGSASTGAKVMEAAAQSLIPVILELGGKDPMIVFEDAPFERAVRGAVYGAFANAGQVCVSVERVYVQESIYDRFVEAAVGKTRDLRVGISEESDVGAMTSAHQISIFNDQVDDALQKGARLLTERKTQGPFVNMVVLKDVNHTMKIMREETFGPALSVMAFKTEAEAVALANDSPYGLNASVWTKDIEKGKRVASRLQAGNCAVNDVIKNVGNPSLPFGGTKRSGMGRYHGPEGLRSFCRTLSVMVNRGVALREPNWFPYGKELYESLRVYLDMFFSDKAAVAKLRGVWGYVRFVRRMRKESTHGTSSSAT